MTIDLYPEIVKEGDLTPDHFGSHIDEICEEIESATKGFGANKQRVVDALATQDATERTKISARYMEMFGPDHKRFKTMGDLMRKEFSGDFGAAMEFLALPPHEAECAMIRRATKGIGANPNVVWSIVCGRTNDELELLKKTYYRMYDQDLGKLLASELHGNMERLVFSCLQAGEETYDPEYHTMDKARDDADNIHAKGQGRWGTDEKGIFNVIAKAPPEHLVNIDKAYTEKYGFTLWKAMEKELSGVAEKSLKAGTVYLLGMKLNPYDAMSKLIDHACKGFGTDELLLTCCIIRFQPHMTNVMAKHIEEFGKSIHDRVREEVRGSYKNLLLQILNTVWPEAGMQ